jgi:hypothetical protein
MNPSRRRVDRVRTAGLPSLLTFCEKNHLKVNLHAAETYSVKTGFFKKIYCKEPYPVPETFVEVTFERMNLNAMVCATCICSRAQR